MKDELEYEAGRIELFGNKTITYVSNNSPYKKYERRVDGDYTFFEREKGEWKKSESRVCWLNVYQKLVQDRKDPRYSKQFTIVME